MNSRRIFAAVPLVLLLATPGAGNAKSTLRRQPPSHDSRVILVRPKVAVLSASAATPTVRGVRLARKDRATVTAPHIRRERFRRYELPAGVTVEAALAEIAATQPNLEAVPDVRVQAFRTPDDTLYPQSWGLSNSAQTVSAISPFALEGGNPGTAGRDIGAEAAWDFQSDCASVVVAVIDSGVNYNHVDLDGNMWVSTNPLYPNHGYDFYDDDDDPMDLDGHGTHVAAIIGAEGNNATGTTGVCWSVQLMALRTLGPTGSGVVSDIVLAIDFAVANGAKVINMSLGAPGPNTPLADAIADAEAADVVVVSAAGNSGVDNDTDSAPAVPCTSGGEGSLCVAALAQDFSLADFSNFGATTVHVGAPGTNVVSTWNGTVTETSPSMSGGWSVVNNTVAPSGWGYAVANAGTLPLLVNPTNLLSSKAGYGPTATDHFYRVINAGPSDTATLSWIHTLDVQSPDALHVYCNGAGGDPISGGTEITALTATNGLNITDVEKEVPAGCRTATATFGYQLTSDGSGSGLGIAIGSVSLQQTSLNGTSYAVISGTSQATPFVSGVAALVRAYRPTATAAQVVEAIKNSGTPVSALSGKTTSGRAVHALGALSYLAAPKNVTAEIVAPTR